MTDQPKLKFALLADNVVIGEKNKPIIFGVFNEIKMESFPFTHPTFNVFTSWTGKKGDYMQTTQILTPTGQVFQKIENTKFSLTKEHPAINVSHRFQLVNFEMEGTYKVQILINGKVAETIELPVKRL